MKKLEEKLLRIIKNMEGNKYLLPDSHSDWFEMATSDFRYKTYVGDRGEGKRYISIVIERPSNSYEVVFANEEIILGEYKLFGKNPSKQKVVNDVEEIYKEKHSFIEGAEGIKSLKKELSLIVGRIKNLQKDRDRKLSEIRDFNSIKEGLNKEEK